MKIDIAKFIGFNLGLAIRIFFKLVWLYVGLHVLKYFELLPL